MPERDYFKQITGKSLKEATRIPSLQETLSKQSSELTSKYEARLLGYAEPSVFITEEERIVNFHIIGAPAEGKSKFLAYNIIEDIKLGNGLCLLDPTSNGGTVNDILRYCASVGYEKVCLIDHRTLYKFQKLACIQPLKGREINQKIYPDEASIDGVMEAVKIIFGLSKLTDTPRMTRRLETLFRVLIRNRATLYETKYFARFNNELREQFLANDEDSLVIAENFRSQTAYENYFSSSVNALKIFWKEPLSLMLAANTGIDFQKMIREGWVILVNLCPGGNFNLIDSQLLGVLIISQLLQAADRLTEGGWKGRYYLYVDEAGRFATPQIDDILAHRRHIGLSLILAHQFYEQFEDKRVLESISQNTGVKVMFNVREPVDRLKMMKSLNYGGEITPEMASFANSDLPKQYAILKKNKQTPIRVRTPDVSIPEIDLDNYIESLLHQPWYLSASEIKQQTNARITTPIRKNPKRPPARKAPNRKAAIAPPVPAGEPKDGVLENDKTAPNIEGRKPLKL